MIEQPVLHINFMKWIFNNQETSRILLNIRNELFIFQEIRCVRIPFIDNISSIQQPRTVKHGKCKWFELFKLRSKIKTA